MSGNSFKYENKVIATVRSYNLNYQSKKNRRQKKPHFQIDENGALTLKLNAAIKLIPL
jgi:hypothetical protein